MKAGARALGIAESYTGETSTLAGVLMTADGRLDGFSFGSCTVGGTDVSAGIINLVERLGREDIRAVFLAGVALAWYNIVDLHRLTAVLNPPVVAVTFEESDGLESGITAAFDGDERADRLDRYRSLPPRHEVRVGETILYARAVDVPADRAADLVSSYTKAGASRPEPLRVAKLAARAADEVIA